MKYKLILTNSFGNPVSITDGTILLRNEKSEHGLFYNTYDEAKKAAFLFLQRHPEHEAMIYTEDGSFEVIYGDN